MEEQLFAIIMTLGEQLHHDFHIIEMTYVDETEFYQRSFRVYHKDCICFDITMSIEESETDYTLYQEWEGFVKKTPKELIDIFEKYN